MELDGRVLTAHGPRALGERGTKMNRIEILEQWLGLLYVCWIAADVGADKKGRPSSVRDKGTHPNSSDNSSRQ